MWGPKTPTEWKFRSKINILSIITSSVEKLQLPALPTFLTHDATNKKSHVEYRVPLPNVSNVTQSVVQLT